MLDTALEWLAAVAMPTDSEVELIVVDNNSADETRSVVARHKQSMSFNLKYVCETQKGLSYARNAGIVEASGSILAFVDDDCLPNGDWLVEIERAFHSRKELAGIGGWVGLYDERDLPITIRTSPHPVKASPNAPFPLVLGCNMSFRRSAMERIGMFDERLGAGTPLYSSEDSDYIYRMLRAGFEIAYLPEIKVFHAHGRRTDEAARNLENGYMTGRGGFYCKHILTGDLAILRHAYWEFRNLTINTFVNPHGRSASVMGNLLKGMSRYIGVTLKRLTWTV